MVGTPEHAADKIEACVEQNGVDGLNSAFALSPESFEDVVDLLVPEMVRLRTLQGRLTARNVA